jgi:hypothetical protein
MWAKQRCVTETVINTVLVCHICEVEHFSTGAFRVLSFESMLTAFPSAIRKLSDLELWYVFPRTQFPGTNSGTVWPFCVTETGECTRCSLGYDRSMTHFKILMFGPDNRSHHDDCLNLIK